MHIEGLIRGLGYHAMLKERDKQFGFGKDWGVNIFAVLLSLLYFIPVCPQRGT